jgi:hypothetical protein
MGVLYMSQVDSLQNEYGDADAGCCDENRNAENAQSDAGN